MRHVKVATGHHGLAGLALKRAQKAAVGIVPGHAHVDAGEFVLRVGSVDIHKPELVELQRADAALGRGLGDELGRLALAGVGQQRIGAQYAQRFLAAKDRGARVALALGVAPGLVIAGQVDIDLPGYHQTWSYAERKGYSGTAVFSRQEPLRVLRADALLPYAGEGEAAELVAQAATEGRVCALEFDKFWFVDVYTPNAQNELARIDVRMAWDDAYRGFLSALERETGKPVVTCGDFNVAHEEIDLKNPKSNRGNAGFSDEERGKFTELLNAGFTDTWRAANPDVEGIYSWWSYRFNARKNNAGWRIDYFLVSDSIAANVRDTGIRGDIFGSDHCPVTLTLKL